VLNLKFSFFYKICSKDALILKNISVALQMQAETNLVLCSSYVWSTLTNSGISRISVPKFESFQATWRDG